MCQGPSPYTLPGPLHLWLAHPWDRRTPERVSSSENPKGILTSKEQKPKEMGTCHQNPKQMLENNDQKRGHWCQRQNCARQLIRLLKKTGGNRELCSKPRLSHCLIPQGPKFSCLENNKTDAYFINIIREQQRFMYQGENPLIY
jgi:hypothetical protein